VKRLGEFSANATANLVKTLADVRIGTPSFYVLVLEANMQRLWQLSPQALLNTLEGLEKASRQSAYASVADAIESRLALVGEHIFLRITEFKQCEVLQVSKILCQRHGTPGAEGAQSLSSVGKRTFRRTSDKQKRQHSTAEEFHKCGQLRAYRFGRR
jgi:hypothetical protein